jgi:hypothetical protein
MQSNTHEHYRELIKNTPRRKATVLVVKGSDADDIGGIGLRIMASEANLPVVVEGPSDYHKERIYWPGGINELSN